MQILDNLFGPQARNLERALTKTTQRFSLVNANLANVNTPGYKRRDMDFAIELEGAEGDSGLATIQNMKNQMQGGRTGGGSIRVDGNSVDLEAETSAIVETELHYEYLTQMTSNYFANLKSVIKEGR